MTRRSRSRNVGLACVLVLSLFAAIASGPAAAVAKPSTAPTAGVSAVPQASAIQPGDTENASFNRSNVTEERGDVAAFTVTLSNTSEATLTVGSEAVNYVANATLSDGDGDGQVRVLLNTHLAGRTAGERGVYEAAARADSVSGVDRTTERLPAPLEPSTYNLSVAVGGIERDTATLDLGPRSTDDLVLWTAPAASFDRLEDASDVARAVERGTVTTSDTTALGDVAVHQFTLSGIYGALDATTFARLVERGALDLTMVQTNPGVNRRPARLDLSASIANDAVRVIPDGENDALYVDLNTTRAVFENGPITPGDEFETTLVLNESSNFTEREKSVSGNVTVVDPQLELGDASLAAAPGQRVTGTTSIAPGSEVSIRVGSAAGGAFLRTDTATVRSNGSFAAAFDLSGVAPNTTAVVRASGPLNTSAETEAVVGPGAAGPSDAAAVTFENGTTTGETAVVTNATLPDGGFLALYRGANATAEPGGVLGASGYLENATGPVEIALDEPLAANATLTAVAHADGNRNREFDFVASNGSADGPYRSGGVPVSASARLVVGNGNGDAGDAGGDATDGTAASPATAATGRTTTMPAGSPIGDATGTATTDGDRGSDRSLVGDREFVVAVVALAAVAIVLGAFLARRSR
jgi:hypothetical protein